MIIKNSEEEIEFTSDVINNFKKIDTLYLMSKESLETTVQEFVKTQEQLWHKYLKWVKIVWQSKNC